MDPELQDLLPLFLSEARERLERLGMLAGRIEREPEATAEARREFHTLKGAARMLQLAPLAELCHRAEALLASGASDFGQELALVLDRLHGLLGRIERGEPLAPNDPEPSAEPASPASPPPRPRGTRVTPSKAIASVAAAPAVPPRSAAPAALGPESPAVGAGAPASTTPREGVAAPGTGGGAAPELRISAKILNSFSERATRLRLMVLGGNHFVERTEELARLAETATRKQDSEQVLAALAVELRRLAGAELQAQRQLQRTAERQLEAVLGLQIQPLRGFLLLLGRHARELATSLGKEVRVELEGEETRLDRRLVEELSDALIHLVRNAIDHGLEAPAARADRGKPAAGRLRISALSRGDRVRLAVADDGEGVDPAKVLDAARRKGLLPAESDRVPTSSEVLQLLFTPGFSTRAEVTEVSGRGVGLDAVSKAVRTVGGEVWIESQAGRGTTVQIEVPAVRRGERVMVVRAARRRLALPADFLVRCRLLPERAIVEQDGETFARIGGRLIPFLPLAELLGEAPAGDQLLLEGSLAETQIAVAVEAVEREEEVLVRPLPRAAGDLPWLEGVTLLASGEPVPVVSPQALARTRFRRRPRAAATVAEARRLRVLLVDDSLVTREMERRLLEEVGFEVSAVGDATVGLQRLAAESFDCLVTDIEMPGVDGLELTRRLRRHPHLSRLPVVVVSTRDRPEDRMAGLEAGADAYLAKHGLAGRELVALVRRLAGTP